MVLFPTVFIAALEKNTHLFKNNFNVYHLACMTESFRNIPNYAEALKWH